jgi:hypothetical protein
MKKLLQIASFVFATSAVAQPSLQITNTGNNQTVPANGIVFLSTTPSNNTNLTFDVKNTSASTKTYVAVRYDAILNSGATAYFCFAGTCFGPGTVVSGNLVLAPGQSASQVAGQYQQLSTDLDEGGSAGLSHIKYSFKNINTPSDSIQMNLRYNDPNAGVKESNASIAKFEVYPNPAVNEVNIRLNISKAQTSSVRVLNGLGQVVITKNVSLNAGSNTVQVDTKLLPSGNYYISYDSGDNVVTKKVAITK